MRPVELVFSLQFVELQSIIADDSQLEDVLHRNARMSIPMRDALIPADFEKHLKIDLELRTVYSSMDTIGVRSSEWMVFIVRNRNNLLAAVGGRRRFVSMVACSIATEKPM